MDEIKSPSFKPLYQQVKELMVSRLTDRSWAPGSILPSEALLAAEFGVSQGTVRKALDELTSENLLRRSQGRGTFVTEHTANRSLFHFLNMVDTNNEKQIPESHLVSISSGSATESEARDLGLIESMSVIRIQRNRSLENIPVITEVIVVSSSLTPGLDNYPLPLPNTLYQLYEKDFGFSVTSAREWLTAVSANQLQAEHLDVELGTPLLRVKRIAYTYNAQPVELRISLCHTANHSYLSELT